MKTIIGLLMILGGIAFGLYVGVWWALVGGIVQIIEQIKAPEVNAMVVAVGVVKILFSGVLGWLSAFVLIVPGQAMVR